MELITIRDLVTPWRVRLAGDTWESGAEALVPEETGAQLVWHGHMYGRTEDPAAADEELRKQLESLGYL